MRTARAAEKRGKVPLLLIPGIGCDDHVFQSLPEGRVVLSQRSTIEAMADDVLAQAPDRFALAGHSMGGYVALAVMAKAPGRVDRLALLNTSAAPDTDAQQAARRELLEAVGADYPAVARRFSRLLVHDDRRDDEKLVSGLESMFIRVGPQTFARHVRAALERPDLRPVLSSISLPVLVLTGADDRIIDPKRSVELAEAIRSARLMIVPSCGHVPMMERPEEAARPLLDFMVEAQP